MPVCCELVDMMEVIPEARRGARAHTAAPRLTSRDRCAFGTRDILSLFSCRVTLQNKYLSRMSYSLIQRVL